MMMEWGAGKLNGKVYLLRVPLFVHYCSRSFCKFGSASQMNSAKKLLQTRLHLLTLLLKCMQNRGVSVSTISAAKIVLSTHSLDWGMDSYFHLLTATYRKTRYSMIHLNTGIQTKHCSSTRITILKDNKEIF